MRDIRRIFYVMARFGFISIAIGLAISVAALIPFTNQVSVSTSVGPRKARFVMNSIEPGTTVYIKARGEGLELYVLKFPIEFPILSPVEGVNGVEVLDALLAVPGVQVVENKKDALSLVFYSEERCIILLILANRGDEVLSGYWDVKVERRLVPPHKAVWFVGGFMGAGACMVLPWAYTRLKERRSPR